MWGNGGRFYWGRKESGVDHNGTVVVFAWLSSVERNLKPYIDLYGSLGWNSLICHVDFLTVFFPEKATSLTSGVLNELVKEVNIRPLPIVLTSFSGASKGCLYKVLQLVEGKCEGHLYKDEYQLVRDCICGQRFGPFLVLCSEDDKLAPYPIVCNFAQRLQEHGGDVKLVKCLTSPHVAHYKYHQDDYKAAVIEFLAKVSVVYFSPRQLNGETIVNEVSSSNTSEPASNFRNAAFESNESLAIVPSDDFFLPSSMEFNDARERIFS